MSKQQDLFPEDNNHKPPHFFRMNEKGDFFGMSGVQAIQVHPNGMSDEYNYVTIEVRNGKVLLTLPQAACITPLASNQFIIKPDPDP